MVKDEVARLCRVGVLEKCSPSAWSAPTFIVPKKNYGIRFVKDFRQLNSQIKRKPFPIPIINETFWTLEGFQYETTIDLNMDIIMFV